MSSVVNYFKDRAHRASDFPNVIMNYWNRSNYVQPALLVGAACLSGCLGSALPEALSKSVQGISSLAPAIPALGRDLATAFLGFGMASLAHSKQISHASETAQIGRATFWKRALVAGAMIGGMFVSPPATVVLAACSRPLLGKSETIQESDNPGADPSFKNDDGRVLDAPARDPLAGNEQLNADASRSSSSRDEMDEKHSSDNERNEISLVSSSYSDEDSVEESSETDSDSDIDEPDEWLSTDPDQPGIKGREFADSLMMSKNELRDTQELILSNVNALTRTRTRSKAKIKPSCQARMKAKAAACFKRVSKFCKNNATSLIAGASIASGALIPALNSEGMQNLALKGLLAISVPATGIWASPKSISQQPEFVAGAAAGLLTIGFYHPTGLMVATAAVAATKLGFAVKNYFFSENDN